MRCRTLPWSPDGRRAVAGPLSRCVPVPSRPTGTPRREGLPSVSVEAAMAPFDLERGGLRYRTCRPSERPWHSQNPKPVGDALVRPGREKRAGSRLTSPHQTCTLRHCIPVNRGGWQRHLLPACLQLIRYFAGCPLSRPLKYFLGVQDAKRRSIAAMARLRSWAAISLRWDDLVAFGRRPSPHKQFGKSPPYMPCGRFSPPPASAQQNPMFLQCTSGI